MSKVVCVDTSRLEPGTLEAAMHEKLGGEFVHVGKVVGAEKERAQLEGACARVCVRVSVAWDGMGGGKAVK